jgi:hypothetical protein
VVDFHEIYHGRHVTEDGLDAILFNSVALFQNGDAQTPEVGAKLEQVSVGPRHFYQVDL